MRRDDRRFGDTRLGDFLFGDARFLDDVLRAVRFLGDVARFGAAVAELRGIFLFGGTETRKHTPEFNLYHNDVIEKKQHFR